MARLVVIGGGAAGFFCAVNAARLHPSLEVIILEKSNKLLSKVKISGGGRCNVTHACFSIDDMTRHYPRGARFLKKAFHQFFTTDTIQWFEERGVPLKKEDDGRMFPATNTSQTIIDCLLKEANRYGVEVRMNADVRSVKYEVGDKTYEVGSKKYEEQGLEAGGVNNSGRFVIELSRLGDRTSDILLLTSDFVCIACGGFPKPEQFNWITQTGHTIEAPVPSLFTFNMPGNAITQLMGVSVSEAQVKVAGSNLLTKGPLLITHWGMSGPAVLRLSAWGARQLATDNYQFSIIVNWLPEYNEQTLRERFQQLRFELASQKMINRNPFNLPQRLWQYLLEQSGINEAMRWADLPLAKQNKLTGNCCSQQHQVQGKTTFREEFVTAGGIQLLEVDVNTMQSKLVPHLFFAGEILDVDGITGGFNFQHAWTSGFIAAKGIAAMV